MASDKKLSDEADTSDHSLCTWGRSLWRSLWYKWKLAGTIWLEYTSKKTLRHMDFEEHYLFSGHNKCRYYTRDSRSRSNKSQRKPEVYNT